MGHIISNITIARTWQTCPRLAGSLKTTKVQTCIINRFLLFFKSNLGSSSFLLHIHLSSSSSGMMVSFRSNRIAFFRLLIISLFSVLTTIPCSLNRISSASTMLFSIPFMVRLIFFCNTSTLWIWRFLLLCISIRLCAILLFLRIPLLFPLSLSLNLTSSLFIQGFYRCILNLLLLISVRFLRSTLILMNLALCLHLCLQFGSSFVANLMFILLLLNSAIFGSGPSQRLARRLCWRLLLLLLRLLGCSLFSLSTKRLMLLPRLFLLTTYPSNLSLFLIRFMLFVMVLIHTFLQLNHLLLWFVQTFHPIPISKFLLSLKNLVFLVVVLLLMSFLPSLYLDLEFLLLRIFTRTIMWSSLSWRYLMMFELS